MAELRPFPFGRLVNRMFRELEERGSIFDLPKRAFFLGDPDRDLSVRFHGLPASTPFGPAAGPHSQLAQNIVLAFLGGARVFELKTVQVKDELSIPRPCIDMRNVGYNVEWSQELKLPQSLEEYVKASMLIKMLCESGKLDIPEGMRHVVFDMSVGYDLAGIESESVQAFIRGMKDAKAVIDRLRGEILVEFKALRDLNFETELSKTLTLSTFHGCPPDEIEKIIEYLLEEHGLHCVTKLNPTLLGPEELRHLMHDKMGYREILTPDSAFEKDTRWEQAVGFAERLSRKAAGLGLSYGVKFSNTLIVENHPGGFLPASEKEMYLSGPPLHVLAMSLVRRFRKLFGDRIPVSFSAGIDRMNFPDAVALGLAPITVCSDLLKPGGYARGKGYFDELIKRMAEAGAASVDEFILNARGKADAALANAGLKKRPSNDSKDYAAWVSRAKLLNTEDYAASTAQNPRYSREGNSLSPKKVGSKLLLFDCLTCDKCVPVCPNDANFTYLLPQEKIAIVKLVPKNGGFEHRKEGTLKFAKKHQLANFADFCNECGNCDIFCPEDGGPYALKPRFFGTLKDWKFFKDRDGFFVVREGACDTVYGRFQGMEYRMTIEGDAVSYSGEGFKLAFKESDPEGSVKGEASGEVDLTYFHIMNRLRRAVLAIGEVNYVNR